MKQMIWSSYDLLDETAKEEYQNSQREILDDDSYEVSDEEWAEVTKRIFCAGKRNVKPKAWSFTIAFPKSWIRRTIWL